MPAKDPRDRIRLADVADHLVGVEQVVDRDEIEARGEFLPEHRFGDGDEQQHEQDQREPSEAQHAVRARARQRLGSTAS